MGVNQSPPVITIDGPSGTGKGTLCAELAKCLGWHMLDSGAIYRLLALSVQDKSFQDVSAIVQAAYELDFHFDLEGRVFLGHEDVSLSIRQEACGQRASQLGALPEIREALLARQRAFLEAPGLVTDGRDMGTVVFPQALVKFYLNASQEIRAGRRHAQLKAQGICVSLAQVADELAARDARDSSRTHAPLMPATEAVVIDTTDLPISEVLEKMLSHLRGRGVFGEGVESPSKIT